jgi:hypothetical protein
MWKKEELQVPSLGQLHYDDGMMIVFVEIGSK